MQTINLTIESACPMLMHSDRGVDPLDPEAREQKKITAKRNKSEEDIAAVAKLDWKLALYHDPEVGPYIPSANLLAMIRDAAKLRKMAAAVMRGGIIVDPLKIPLKYRGPRDVEGLWSSGRFADSRSVVVSGRRVIRYRPVFSDWSASFSVSFNPEFVDEDIMRGIIEDGGRYIGLGDFRPQKYGNFGRFEIVSDVALAA